MKNKNVQKCVKKENVLPQSDSLNFDHALELIIQKRNGGAVNIRGIGFQLLFSIHTLLEQLDSHLTNTVRLEGIEDLDLRAGDNQTYFQIKTSQNTIDASTIWELKVFQHFYEVYRINPSAYFVIIHNTSVSKGNLDIVGTINYSQNVLTYWQSKFVEAGIIVEHTELQSFFKRIIFKKVSEIVLFTEIKKTLYNKYNINLNAEQPFIKALFYHSFEWAKQKTTVTYQDLYRVINSIADSFSTFPVNPALQNSWIVPMTFEIGTNEYDNSYFDGKAARPVDIARGLPVKRPVWENLILKGIVAFDVIVIKSSSGQGKSTLAWQVSQSLTSQGFVIYQLQYCSNLNDATAVADYLLTRILIGEIPVLVIDGLNKSVSGWSLLAEKMRDNPVKLIITTREEDWVRYGSEITNLTLKVVDIKLTDQEAETIYAELKKHNKLYSGTTTWQPAWERIKENGLLIEFVYLLTRGELLSKRLASQIHQLNTEVAAGIKLEILRLIAIADILNIRLSVKSLSKYLLNRFTSDTDQNEIYRQLEKEYYLNFEKNYVQGLHPVRSRHLVDILLSNIPSGDSLLNLLYITDEDFIYDYFIGVPLQFKDLDKAFWEEAAAIMGKRKKSEMVYAIDGLMHYEPEKYWISNKEIYNEVSATGGIDLFVYDSIPFNNLSTIENISSALSGSDLNSNMQLLGKKLKLLSPYKIESSEVRIFTEALSKELEKQPIEGLLEGVGFLYKWFKRLSVSFPDIILVEENNLLKQLSEKNINETAEIFNYFRLFNADQFKIFIEVHNNEIIGHLKKKTNTLTIEERGNNLFIEYLLDKDADKANEMSVYRIETIFNFLPFHQRYCTSAIILPFPNEDIYKVVRQNAHKQMPVENITDMFDVHINQIWAKVLLEKYSYTSSYEWQKNTISLREQIVALVKKLTYFFEYHIEQNEKKVNTAVKEIVRLSNEFFEVENQLKKYPSQRNKYFEKNAFTKYENKLSAWRASFRNFINQMPGIFKPLKEHDRNLPLINLNEAVFNLQEMQNSYNVIANLSYTYFTTNGLEKEESLWINRLNETVNFYAENPRQKEIVASKAVKEWWLQKLQEELTGVCDIITEFGEDSAFKFYFPSKIIQNGNLKTCTIGVSNFDILVEDELFLLSAGLCDLADTGIHFFTFVVVSEEMEVTGAFRVGDNYFKKFQKLLNDDPIENDGDWGNLLPVIPDEKMISVLDGVRLKKAVIIPSNEAYFSMLMNCWKLSEYRARLDKTNSIEAEWLAELESEYSAVIRNDAGKVYCDGSIEVLPKKEEIITFLEKWSVLENEKIIGYMNKRAIQLNANL